jgi:hypothetical protein
MNPDAPVTRMRVDGGRAGIVGKDWKVEVSECDGWWMDGELVTTW